MLAERVESCLIFDEELLIPNEQAIMQVDRIISERTDLVLGVGSGVINDLCKYCSFSHKLPYFIVATAPSMDGYASMGAAMLTGGMKTTFSAHPPAAIIGDVDILKNAPMPMIQAGFGDIIGKYSALNDWRLAHTVLGEYYCEAVDQLVMETVERTRMLADGICKRESEAIKALMEALVIVGVAMSYVGSSRPASGSEHHLSHFFEVTGILRGEPYLAHGLDVAYACVMTQQMREKLLSLECVPRMAWTFDRAHWKKQIRECYGNSSQGVMALQDRCGYYESALSDTYRQKWNEICAVLQNAPSSTELCAILETVGLDMQTYLDIYNEEKRGQARWFAKDLKDRYTVLWLYFSVFYQEI